jgi:putative ABC transport system permease protein
MVTLGNGATRAVSDQISSLGSNLVMIRPGQRLGPGRDSAGAPAFKRADADALRGQINGLEEVVPVAGTSVTVVAGNNNWSTTVSGTTNGYLKAGNWRIAGGREFLEEEERAGKAVCIIGATVKRELFGARSPLGDEIRVKSFACQVVGLLAAKGQGAMGMDQDDTVLMPLVTVQRRLTGNQDVSSLMVSLRDGIDAQSVMQQIRSLLRERRKLAENEGDNFNVMDTKQIAETLSGTIRTMTGLLGAVAAVSLLVGGIGIMNIMLVSVTERTREIGIRLAIGALEHEVLLQFLIEAVVLSACGGLIGIILALLACLALSALLSMPFLFNTNINLLAFLFSAAIGVLFGYMPARRAARLDPIQALRHE